MPRGKKNTDAAAPLSTRASLSSTIKTIRNIMRKDKGLNGDLDRLPMLTWLMFLKFLDDSDDMHKVSDELAGRSHKELIEPPYRWRDWAGPNDGLTGDELKAFINQDEAMRPDGTRGPGLFAYLKTRSGGRGDVVANVFRELQNRMVSGYLLRDVINKINEITFTSSENIHTLSHLYESMLREMRDAAGDSGEFYTPRPVVKFMIQMLDPKLGETVLDPACGTGGFLVEAYEHIKEQARLAEHYRVLQEHTLFGNEAKPLPYLLAQMNLVLHGVESPNVTIGNSLAVKLSEIGDAERVDVIATNPPFGGEEERSIQGGFPADKRTSETALLFLQLIMRRLRRQPKPGRAAVVVPNGSLYVDGVGARIRQELLSDFRLYAVVRLPKGVFEPYADIPTNILFFDRSSPESAVWFYEHPLPPHRRDMSAPTYSKTDPLQFEEFAPLIESWEERPVTPNSWHVSIASLESEGWNLDVRNPHRELGAVIRPTIMEHQLEVETRIVAVNAGSLKGAAELVEQQAERISDSVKPFRLDQICSIQKGRFPTMKTPPGEFPLYVLAERPKSADDLQMDGEGLMIPLVSSTGHGHASIHRLHYANGQFAVATNLALLTALREDEVDMKFLFYYLSHHKHEKLVNLMTGTANTSLSLTKISGVRVELPSYDSQVQIRESLDTYFSALNELRRSAEAVASECANAIGEGSKFIFKQ